MGMSASDVRTKMTAAAATIEAGDFATAITKAQAALALLGAIPDSEHDRGFKMAWRADIQDFIKTAQQSQSADTSGGGGIQRTKIQWEPTSAPT